MARAEDIHVQPGSKAGRAVAEHRDEQRLQAVEELKRVFGTEDLAAIAIRWVLMHPEVSVVIPGASRAEQVRSNVKAAELAPLSEQQMKDVEDIYNRCLRESIHPQW